VQTVCLYEGSLYEGSLYEGSLYEGSEVAELPGGPLELKDFSQIHGPSLSERLESFFPGLPAKVQRALLHELS
jgi:hypothetical protein